MRLRRFRSSFVARRFIETDGPSKTGQLGFAILTNETRNVPTRLDQRAAMVPVTGGENDGGSVQAGEVIDAIDCIIGRWEPQACQVDRGPALTWPGLVFS